VERLKGIWEKLLEVLTDEFNYEWFMIDASHIKVHPHPARAGGGNQNMNRVTKGGLNIKIHLAVDAHGMPIRDIITQGTTADCTQAKYLRMYSRWLSSC
jgi:transposase